VRLTMGGEPTFVSVDDMEGGEWTNEAVGPTKRKFAEDLALAKAFIDPAMQIPNFSYFKNKFPEQIPDLNRKHKRLAMFIFDLHGFRELVGLLGPDVLEEAYRRYVEKMNQFLLLAPWSVSISTPKGESAYLISLPGEQVMLLAEVEKSDLHSSAEGIAEALLTLSNEPITINGIDNKIGFTLGYAQYNPQTMSIYECFRQAQVALLTGQRKRLDHDSYSPEQDDYIKQRLLLLAELRLAITTQALQIYIQPQFNVATQTLTGGEVLVRWSHPEKGMISPAVFIPLAEQTRLVFDITKTVFIHTCHWLKAHPNTPDGFHLSVNLSALDLNDPRLIPFIQRTMDEFQLRSDKLLFEVTESAVMDDPKRFLYVINSLHKMGFKVAIDDFGTGYSSMTYLQKMHADEIKIDISFIRNIHLSETNQNIVKAIVQLASSTNAYTVAEGIENQDELAVLKELDCTIAQGFFWSPAIPADEFAARYLSTVEGPVNGAQVVE